MPDCRLGGVSHLIHFEERSKQNERNGRDHRSGETRKRSIQRLAQSYRHLLGAIFFIAGFYIAVQEALESTVTAELVQADTLAMSYGALGTVNGRAKFVSSTAVGVLWTTVSPALSLGLAALLMTFGTVALERGRRKNGTP